MRRAVGGESLSHAWHDGAISFGTQERSGSGTFAFGEVSSEFHHLVVLDDRVQSVAQSRYENVEEWEGAGETREAGQTVAVAYGASECDVHGGGDHQSRRTNIPSHLRRACVGSGILFQRVADAWEYERG